jgi:probable HAF family extracellular repeat protein
MRRTTIILLLATTTLCATSTAIAVGPYVLTDLGNLPGAAGYYAYGINSSGQVVGHTESAAIGGVNFPERAFLWTPNTPNGTNGSLAEIGPPSAPSTLGRAFAINDLGQVVGYRGSSLQGFLWTPTTPNGNSGTMVELGTLQRHPEAWPLGINSMGQIAGDAGLQSSAFLWNPDRPNGPAGTMIDLGHLPGGCCSSYALAINSVGQIVGQSHVGIPSSPRPKAFLWTPTTPNGNTGSMVDLGDLPGGSVYSYASDINSRGQVVGASQASETQEFRPHAFLWTPDTPNGSTGGMINLGALPGMNSSRANAINSLGQVVGASGGPLVDDPKSIFLWTPDIPNGTTGAMIDLKTLLPPQSVTGWTFLSATGINDRAQISGYGWFDADGPGGARYVTRAFLLTPVPEPRTVSMALYSAISVWFSALGRMRPTQPTSRAGNRNRPASPSGD